VALVGTTVWVSKAAPGRPAAFEWKMIVNESGGAGI
jgi:hypothetical protein